MPHSDDDDYDYGIDDDDTAFLRAATQLEATQHAAAFDPSPRPSKKRRVRRRGRAQVDAACPGELEWSETDEENHSPPASSLSGPPGNGPAPAATTDTQHDLDPADNDDPNYYFPGELAEDNHAKTSKYRIHVPENGGKFPDMIFSQTQHGLDDDLAKFRGAVWKRPPRQAPLPNLGGIANANGLAKGAAPPIANGIGSYFRAVGRPVPVEDDAAFAARLQEEEDALDRGRQPVRPVRPRVEDRPTLGVSQQELATQLDDLPSDAFSSSSPEKSPTKAVIELSSQVDDNVPRRHQSARPRAPKTGLKQMTIFGQPATQDLTASQAAAKRHAWPLSARDEPPTHHKLDEEAMKTWVYPTNLGTIRDYQYNIVSRSLFHNTLVALPTGLGKTFIAATVMLNYYRWTTKAQLVFMAPTKPLIAQQLEACYGIVGIPSRDTVLMTGETTPAARADEWQEKRVFFMTPQTVINDLKTGICDPKRIVLLVVDEAHKATGGYAYTEVVSFMRRFNSSFRVLALTATPGSSTEAVQAVIDNLGIARVELRTEQSLDIREYTHEKQSETEVFDFSDEQERIMDLCSRALRPSLDKLNSQNAYWSRDPMMLTAYGLTQARQKWMSSDAGRKAPMPVKGMINSIFTVLSSIAHSISLLKFHGIGPFYSGILSFQSSVNSGEQKGKTAAAIASSDDFNKMLSTVRTWTNNPEFIGHPKLEYLREVVLNHFLDAGEGRQGSDVPPSATRVMVFASFRDSTEEICRVLKRNEPMIRPHVFVGQAASKGQEGMDQKRQNAVIQDFKSGKYNTLIATSIGEEGLDIGTVDLIVCYDASSSPIRMLQRIGRTGRKRLGRVVLLLMKGKEENDYAKAQDNYAYIQKTIADASKYAYRDDQSPRILPKEVKPVADKRPVDIPVENSQPVDLNEKKRKGRGKGRTKRPPKKFHMPDNVRTGFTTAANFGFHGDDPSEDERPKKKSTKRQQKFIPPPTLSTPEPEAAPLPYLANVFLNDEKLDELAEKYARSADVEGDALIREPDLSRFPEKLRSLGPTKYVAHGQATRLVEKTMQVMRHVDNEKLHRLDECLHLSDLEDAGTAGRRLVSPEANDPDNRPLPVVSKSPIATGTAAVKKRRGRPKKAASPPPQPDDSEAEPDLPPGQMPPPPSPGPAKRPRGRPRKEQTLQRTASYGSAAGEGASSSPAATPADMRLATQIMRGEELGEEDTSGEEQEEEADSEDLAFIAKSSDPLEMASSFQHFPDDDDDDDEKDSSGRDECDVSEKTSKVVRKRRVVEDSEDEE
ncbi:ATP-dependent DNA helicase mph1 [Lecanosticta acicola]|uniref:ATP-dependent DNA helicase n=1 Tax=Lecanosticta acicola TaxID=111012 RepID=A0AAI8Z1S3_9PEZI|nr:ATP-dependent DNA helicase mph1 [Lecanosticta acicola]